MSASPTPSGTIARVAKLLRVLAESEGPSTLSSLAERMALPASTTHRLLNLLAEQGFVQRDSASKGYGVGLELFRIGALVSSRLKITDVATEFMQAVVDECDETCMLSLRDASSHHFVIAKLIYGSHPLRYAVELYQRSSLLWGAPGRGILAFLPKSEIAAAIAAEPTNSASHRPQRSLTSLQQDLEQTRSNGYAFTHGQNVQGAVGISAPIFNAVGVVGALCVTIPETRFTDSIRKKVSKTVVAQAARLSATLGG